MLRNVPIRRKLIAIILIASGAVSLLTSLALLVNEWLLFRSTAVRELRTLGQIIASNSTAALAFRNPDDAHEILGALRAEPHLSAAALYNENGALFAAYPATGLPLLPKTPGPDGYAFTPTHLVAVEPVLLADRRIGTVCLMSDLNALTARIHVYGLTLLGVAVVGFVVAYALSSVLQRQISRPILALADTAREVSERKDYSIRATRTGKDEVGALTTAFNEMLEEIDRLHRGLEQRVAERTTQLTAANKELEAFSYSVSHDLRAPLRHIDGFAQLLQDRCSEQLDEKSRHFLSTIIMSAKRLGTLIDELLVFSRMGRSELRHSRVEMEPLVDEVRREFESEAEGRNIEWKIDPLPSVHADPAMLRQVWANLIGNALKYTRKQPAPRIEIQHRMDNGDGHVFAVRDNGAGFDMKYVAKLFGVFQRLHSGADFEGTGIGLANVQRIVHRHGGRVWAEGKVDEGATFFFTLPASESNDDRSTRHSHSS